MSATQWAAWLRRASLSLVVMLLIAPPTPAHPAAADLNAWSQAGALGGRIDSLVIDPQTPTTLPASTPQGVYRSTDAGTTRRRASSGLPLGETGALAIDPRTSTTLYVGTHNGVYRSTDRGSNWSSANVGLPAPHGYVGPIAIAASSPERIYIGYGARVYRSIDRGGHCTARRTRVQPGRPIAHS
jgi:hypothetical protein